MKRKTPTRQARRPRVRPALHSASATPSQARPGPHLNAMAHGIHSGHVLLPGDNIAKFRDDRRRLFHLHRPRTVEEARCVEVLASADWRMNRCQLEAALFKQHLGAVLSGHPDATSYLATPDAHRLHHRGTDALLEESRLSRLRDRALARLRLLQHERTLNHPAVSPAAVQDYTVFMAEGEPVVEHNVAQPVPGGSLPANAPTPATPGSDGTNPNLSKRAPTPAARRFPKHWSHRQRQAALQREAGQQENQDQSAEAAPLAATG